MKNGTIIQCITDVSNFGNITIQKGIFINGNVYLSDGNVTTLKKIKNFLKRPNLILWSQYNKTLEKWRKIGNIKVL